MVGGGVVVPARGVVNTSLLLFRTLDEVILTGVVPMTAEFMPNMMPWPLKVDMICVLA